jgi:membrane fusion protein (multidrug efflux system)
MDEGAQPGRRTQIALWAVVGILVLGGLVLRATAPSPQPASAVGESAAAIEVTSLEVAKLRRPDRVVASGVLEARRSVRLSSEVSGRVLEIGAEALDRVEASQLLVQIDPLRARVAVERAQAAVTRAESELGLARTSFERQQSLKDRAVASESAFDDASNRSRVAESAIRDARAQLDEARDTLAKKTIRAPFAGALRSFHVERGEVVSVGQEIGELLDLGAARVKIGLSDRQIVALEAGATVAVEVEAYPGESFAGTILRVGAAADEGTKRFPAEIEIANADRRLLPGMVVRVELDLASGSQRMLVPREALVREFGLGFVYVLAADEDGSLRAQRRRVDARLLPFDPAYVEISSGLADGERVAVSGVRALRDGMRVSARSLAVGEASLDAEADAS